MRTMIAIVTLGMAVGVWGCDKSGGKEGATKGHPHEGENDHAHGGEEDHRDEKGHAHEGDEGHAHEGDEGHAHEGDEGHAHEDDEGHAHEDDEGHAHKGDEEHAHEGEKDHHGGEEGHHHTEPNYAKEGTVDVPNEGKEFEPPVPVDRLPKGAWYCDMGKAPWAATEEPDDGCPIEGAPLKQVSK